MYQKVHKFQDAVYYFNVTHWTFHGENIKRLWSKLNEADRKTFNFDMATINWDDYTNIGIQGVRRYLMKDDPKTIPVALKRMQR